MKRQTSGIIAESLAVAALAIVLAIPAVTQTETILHNFINGNDGAAPQSGLVFDSKGNLYGTTLVGGTTPYCSGCGTVYQLVPNPNGTWTENVLYAFGESQTFADGTDPWGPLILDSKGNLYGTTGGGGSTENGAVFELTPGSNGIWTETVLHSFAGGTDGAFPYAGGLIFDGAGNLYGTTDTGGAYRYGTVYELSPSANGWTEKVLYSFQGLNDGGTPVGSTLVMDGSGNLYGVTQVGGAHDYGVVFKLTPGSSGWTEKVLHAFTGGAAGSYPTGNLILDGAGNLYGQASYIIYELTPNAKGVWTQKVLHRFTGGTDGAQPYAGLTMDKAGNLFGTTYAGGQHRGTVFELSPTSTGTWTEKILHAFTPATGDGGSPAFAGLVLDASGNIYGTAQTGGSSNAGVVFEITP